MSLLKHWLVLCWNIRGLNSKAKQLALANAIELSGCAVICLQETKMENIDLSFIKSCCPKRFDDFAYIPSFGASGGIVIIWNSSLFHGLVMHCQPFAISVNFTSTQHSGETQKCAMLPPVVTPIEHLETF